MEKRETAPAITPPAIPDSAAILNWLKSMAIYFFIVAVAFIGSPQFYLGI
jgi:hypothetical protein